MLAASAGQGHTNTSGLGGWGVAGGLWQVLLTEETAQAPQSLSAPI